MITFIEYGSVILSILLLVYTYWIAVFYRGLSKLREGTNTHIHTVTVIIPARNEEKNIERCLTALLRQDYPKDKLSLIVIDDQSTDGTAEIVRRIADTSTFPIQLHRSEFSSTVRSPKIRAMMLGIRHSSSDIIVTTDADCTMPERWISSINSWFEPHIGVVTGVTVYEKKGTLSPLFWGIQFLDFISYTAIGAGAIGNGRVLVSNGSNMAFRIQAFDETGGFDTLTHINTGDDSLLAQRLTADGRWTARFAYGTDATVSTQPVDTWKEVLHQRMRWVGQTAYYPPSVMFFMVCTFIMFVGLMLTLPLTFVLWHPLPWIILLLNITVDFVMMREFTRITRTSEAMRYFIPTAIIHIPFVLLATIGGYFFSFEWKDRSMKKESA
jgi:cellulose synthase/poly-beta-1,6-N-acetylglucosamine synthase-like glycosyltransferase